MNTDTAERTISMTELLYRVFRRWRGILIFGLLAALAAGGYKGMQAKEAVKTQSQSGKELQSAAAVSAASEVPAAGESKTSGTETYQSLLKKLENRQTETREYLDNSILVSIDPSHEAQANVTVTIQAEDPEQRPVLQKAYENFFSSGIDWSGLEQKMNTEKAYLQELVSFGDEWKGSEGVPVGVITLKVKHRNTRDAQRILEELLDQMKEQQPEIAAAAGTHTLSTGEVTTGYFADPQLEVWLSEKLRGYAEIATDMDRLEAEQSAGSTLSSGEGEDASDIAKTVVSYALAGFFLGIVLAVLLLMVWLVCRRRVLSAGEWNRIYGFRSLALLPDRKKRHSPLDRLVGKLDAEKKNQMGAADRYQVATRRIVRYCDTDPEFGRNGGERKTVRTILVTGDVSAEILQETAGKLAGLDADRTYLWGTALADDPETMKKMEQADAVILVEQIEISRYRALQADVTQLRSWKIPVLGTITL